MIKLIFKLFKEKVYGYVQEARNKVNVLKS